MVTNFQSQPSFDSYFRTGDIPQVHPGAQEKTNNSLLITSTILIGIIGIVIIYHIMNKDNKYQIRPAIENENSPMSEDPSGL